MIHIVIELTCSFGSNSSINNNICLNTVKILLISNWSRELKIQMETKSL